MTDNHSKESSRKSSIGSNSTDTCKNTLNSHSQSLMCDKKIEIVQEKPISFQMPPKECIPEMLRVLLFIVVILTYLICAVFHFIHTGDMMSLGTALVYAGAYAGIAQITPLVDWSKKEKE